jgi:hypothetical protein
MIENYLDGYYNETIFKKDMMTPIYSSDALNLLLIQWSADKIKIVLDMIEFLSKDYMAANNVQSLEIFINNIDSSIEKIIENK